MQHLPRARRRSSTSARPAPPWRSASPVRRSSADSRWTSPRTGPCGRSGSPPRPSGARRAPGRRAGRADSRPPARRRERFARRGGRSLHLPAAPGLPTSVIKRRGHPCMRQSRRGAVTGESFAQVNNPDPFAPPVWRSPVYRTPEFVIWLVQLARLLVRVVWFVICHPLLDAGGRADRARLSQPGLAGPGRNRRARPGGPRHLAAGLAGAVRPAGHRTGAGWVAALVLPAPLASR